MANSASYTVYTDKEELDPPYPNPTRGMVTIPWNVSLGNFDVYVYNVNYEFQFKKSFDAEEESPKIDLGGLRKGTYIVVVEGDELYYREQYKIIVE